MLKYEKFKQSILQIIQQSGLDVGIVIYILKDILHDIEILYNQKIQEEYKMESESEQKED